jgi:uncharacterized protein (TIGR02270 family)
MNSLIKREILWDIVEEHFDESEFLFGQWRRALYSPNHTLADLGRTFERRLAAHLDALLIAGDIVADRILYPRLQDASTPRSALVAALAVLSEGSQDSVLSILELALGGDGGPLQDALTTALGLVNVTEIDRLTRERMELATSEKMQAVLLSILTARGINPKLRLSSYSTSTNPRLLAAALAAAGRFADMEQVTFAERLLEDRDPVVQKTAFTTALILGSRFAWRSCLQSVEYSPNPHPVFCSVVAMLGGPTDHEILFRQLQHSAQLEAKIWSIGLCGTVAAGNLCLTHLESGNDRIAKVAADSLAWIGGADLKNPDFQKSALEPSAETTLPPLEEDDLSHDLNVDGVDEASTPNIGRIADWWTDIRTQFDRDRRYILGRPFSLQSVIRALEEGPLWRRHDLALEVAIRTKGKEHVSSNAFSSRQRREIGELSSLSTAAWPAN